MFVFEDAAGAHPRVEGRRVPFLPAVVDALWRRTGRLAAIHSLAVVAKQLFLIRHARLLVEDEILLPLIFGTADALVGFDALVGGRRRRRRRSTSKNTTNNN